MNVEFMRPATTDHNAVVGNIFDSVMSDLVVATLRHKDSAGMPIELANVVNVIVRDHVVLVLILGARSIAGKHDAVAA